MIFPILAEIAKLRPEAPIRRGQVLIADVLGTGVDVIATRTVLQGRSLRGNAPINAKP